WHYLHQYRWARTGLTVILIILQILTTTAQFGHISNQRAISERWEWDCRALGITLNQAFATQEPLVAVTAAGCLPYWSELPSIDMLGLNDYYLPRHKPADMGTGLLGHELGDGDYVLQRSPDMVIFHIGIQPIFLTGKQLSENPAFHQQYREISIRTAVEPYYTALVWVKVASNLIGYVQSDGEVRIPAYFLNAFETTTAWFDGDQLVISVDRDHPAGVVVDQLPASYTLTVVSRHAEQIKASVEPAEQGSRIVLTSEGTAPLAVEALVITDTSR
ncbi:MAG: hypothetical protein HGA65_07860, partial [Oscillochloris sp.]|nr:hypothetical protein [Oscillochloris sp.]